MILNFNDLIIYKGGEDKGFKFGMLRALYNHLSGNPTMSEGMPIIVKYIKHEKKYLVVDGYHRIAKGLLEGNLDFNCQLDWFGDYPNWWVPPKDKRFIFEEIKKLTETA